MGFVWRHKAGIGCLACHVSSEQGREMTLTAPDEHRIPQIVLLTMFESALSMPAEL